MRFDIMTIFPEMCENYIGESVIGRAIAANKFEVHCHNIRDYTENKHNRTDDSPYGGGMGMVMTAQPIDSCFKAVCEQAGARPHLIYMSPEGAVLTQQKARELAQMPNIAILCGHYEGIDQRVIDELVDEEISIGDYVLTGGELPALVLLDSVARMLDGVLSSSECYEEESHYSGLLEYPQYTRPPIWNGRQVPEVLLSGDHKKIKQWRREKSIENTMKKRPDMLVNAPLSEQERRQIEDIQNSLQ